jgi:hypothetical protein
MRSLDRKPRTWRPNKWFSERLGLQEDVNAVQKAQECKVEELKADPVAFFKQVLGVEAFEYQKKLLQLFEENQFLAARWCRQSGKSYAVSEALVIYLRTQFNHIRVIIPYGAMSAATMLACSANEIVMGKHSFIGSIDPQMAIRTRVGPQSVPAQAITEQFEMAKEECIKDPKNLGVWLPIIEQYGPALLKQCEHASQLSKELVAKWLSTYMFADIGKNKGKAKKVAAKLSDHSFFKSHGRHIGIVEAKNLGLRIHSLEEDQNLQDLVLSVFHSTTQTFDATPAVKIIENHLGLAFVKQVGLVPTPDKAKQIKERPK